MKQYYKSLYFSDHPNVESKKKAITLAFNEREEDYYNKIRNLSNEEIRKLIGFDNFEEINSFSRIEERSINQIIKRRIKKNFSKIIKNDKKNITFKNSKKIPFQRWYPYIEGYSPDFVTNIIAEYSPDSKIIYDPFVGTGTTIFAADTKNIKTYYSEINPILQFLIDVKIRILKSTFKKRQILSLKLREYSCTLFKKINEFKEDQILKNNYFIIFQKSEYFPKKTFNLILKLNSYIDYIKVTEDDLLGDILSVAAISSLIPISYLKKAGDVRFKKKEELKKSPPENLENFFCNKLRIMAEDIFNENIKLNTQPELLVSNSKNIDMIQNISFDTVITSPPYLNGTNYFRNTKLELWFLKIIQSKEDLRLFRDQTLTSGINDVNKDNHLNNNKINIFEKSIILKNSYQKLQLKTYDKRIPIMVESYFVEIYDIFNKLQKSLAEESKIIIDIGDSVFANVHIQTDNILKEILIDLGYDFIEKRDLRKRRSRNNSILSQTLLIFEYRNRKIENEKKKTNYWEFSWENYKINLPHQQKPFSKRNWGNPNHSLCSYQGKLKPAIANQLVNIFVPESGTILDPFSGVGTIPFEAALNGKKSYGIDISTPAYYISSAKLAKIDRKETEIVLNKLKDYILTNEITEQEIQEVNNFGMNKKLKDYYEKDTLKEIILARRYFRENKPCKPSEMLVISSLMHILHGNRPYALSRRSHPIVPYSPQGEFIYKNLIIHLKNKVNRTLYTEIPKNFVEGKMFNQDSTKIWPQEINNLDAVITSPPFFDSTRFYLANWIRIWFAGWSNDDFKYQINSFIEEKQKINFSIYENIFRQARERMNRNGVFVLHLGKSKKCDMAERLQKISKTWFRKADLFNESVVHCESHGIRDKGTVTIHQYLILV